MSADIAGAARALREAREGRIPCAPVAERFGLLTLDHAYAVQDTNARHWAEAGRTVVGRKIGLTSEAVQRQMGVNQPDFGTLFADMEFLDGAVIPAGRLIQPKAEAEIAFVMAADCPEAELTPTRFLARVSHVLPAIEIVDSAIADWRIGLLDTVADNASSGVYVLGSQGLPPAAIDLRTAGMVLERNGAVASVGVGAACLGHPVNAAVWLARTMVRVGQPLRAGDVVLSGALGPMVDVTPGDRVEVAIGGLGRVAVRFAV